MQKENFSVGNLTIGEGARPSVTQGTNRSTGVTCNGFSGVVVTNATSLAAAGEATFTVTNNRVKATSDVILTIRTPSATATSMVYVSKVQDGSFDITVTNLHAATADTSATTLGFVVLNG